ncbi:MAG TPA: hypothetical protein VMJ10_08185 [Kofleriaceae bacterium]|nr:hypothetical protein [Kofleriaceae bacterium]
MARQRRGGGLRPPELRGTLGTLLRTTREVLERGAREGRERLDEALASRRRDGALAELGEIVLDLVRRGEIDLAELPEARDVLARLDDLDGDAADAGASAAIAPRRDRFDRRSRDDSEPDGTVSAQTWAPPTRKRPADRVWRPVAPPPPDADFDRPTVRGTRNTPHRGGITFDEPPSSSKSTADDLADYMHPDDVPSKPRPDGDS